MRILADCNVQLEGFAVLIAAIKAVLNDLAREL